MMAVVFYQRLTEFIEGCLNLEVMKNRLQYYVNRHRIIFQPLIASASFYVSPTDIEVTH
jgi:hypothetical protein